MRVMANGLEYQFFRKIYRQRFGTDLPVWVDNLGLFERTPVVRMARWTARTPSCVRAQAQRLEILTPSTP